MAKRRHKAEDQEASVASEPASNQADQDVQEEASETGNGEPQQRTFPGAVEPANLSGCIRSALDALGLDAAGPAVKKWIVDTHGAHVIANDQTFNSSLSRIRKAMREGKVITTRTRKPRQPRNQDSEPPQPQPQPGSRLTRDRLEGLADTLGMVRTLVRLVGVDEAKWLCDLFGE